jgi:hypothetical protein
MRRTALLALALFLVCCSARSSIAAEETRSPPATVVRWVKEESEPETLTFYADGTFANDKGERKPRYHWQWTERGLEVRFWTSHFLLDRHDGQRLSGQYAGPKQEFLGMKVSAEPVGEDPAGVFLPLQRLIDGLRPSALERTADRQARKVVAGKLVREWARVQTAARVLDDAAAVVRETYEDGHTATERKRARGADVEQARGKERKYHEQALRRVDPTYSSASFSRALAEWGAWQDRRHAAERDLRRADEDLRAAKSRYDRARADLRKAQSQYDVVAADYWITFSNLWRVEYTRRKAELKTLAAERLRVEPPLPEAETAEPSRTDLQTVTYD